jgi:hypothetical protein
MRIYITCVTKQLQLEFLKLYKFCALLQPGDTAKQEEKQVIGNIRQLPCAVCSLECWVLVNQGKTLESLLSDVMWN